MTLRFDSEAVLRAAATRTLRLPRGPHRGRLGEVRAASVGSSLELHDFRLYSPGDDLRQVDWNAVARTGELVLRVRQDEVSPRVELIVDGSASMACTPEKAARTREIAAWLQSLSVHGGLEPTVILATPEPERLQGPATATRLAALEFEGRSSLEASLQHAPPLRTCGLRVVVSDFLFEGVPNAFAERLARGASGVAFVQVLDPEDLDPTGGAGARLIDAETGEVLERILSDDVLEQYQQRLRAHVGLWEGAARRVRATWLSANAGEPIDRLARGALGPLLEVA